MLADVTPRCHMLLNDEMLLELFAGPVVTIQTSYTCFHWTRLRARL